MSDCCRICLTKMTDAVSLQSSLDEDLAREVQVTILEILEIVTSQKIPLHEHLPCAVCVDCKNILKMTHNLRIQFQNSQKMLLGKFKDIVPTTCEEKMEEKAPVELIFSGQKFDLNDVLIVEDNSDNDHDFGGFLSNLGSTVSAVFVGKTKHKNGANPRKQQQETDDTLQITKNGASKIDDSVEISEKNAPEELPAIQKTDFNKNHTYSVFLCETCGLQSKTKKCRECRKQDRRNTQYMCDVCGYSVSNERKLQYHKESHSGETHTCDICHKQFMHKISLGLHRKSHTGGRPRLCTVCGKTFFYSSALIYHMRMHRDERNYVCHVCDKRFYMSCALKRHIRIHTDDRPYVCAFCGKGFRSNGEKRKHEWIHTGERPYKCYFCERRFSSRFNRSLHHMTHPGPHVCDHCQRSFMEVEFLRKHVQDKHGDGGEEDDNKI